MIERGGKGFGNLTLYTNGGGFPAPLNGVDGNNHDSPANTPDHADGFASEDFIPGLVSSREGKKWIAPAKKMSRKGRSVHQNKSVWKPYASAKALKREVTCVHELNEFVPQSTYAYKST